MSPAEASGASEPPSGTRRRHRLVLVVAAACALLIGVAVWWTVDVRDLDQRVEGRIGVACPGEERTLASDPTRLNPIPDVPASTEAHAAVARLLARPQWRLERSDGTVAVHDPQAIVAFDHGRWRVDDLRLATQGVVDRDQAVMRAGGATWWVAGCPTIDGGLLAMRSGDDAGCAEAAGEPGALVTLRFRTMARGETCAGSEYTQWEVRLRDGELESAALVARSGGRMRFEVVRVLPPGPVDGPGWHTVPDWFSGLVGDR